MPELMEEIIYPGALETKSQLQEDLDEMKAQLSKQIARVLELRIKKVEQPGMALEGEWTRDHRSTCLYFLDAFYGGDDLDLHNIDVMTDVSMAPTTFTRYTAAPSAVSKKSRWVTTTLPLLNSV